MKSKTIDDLYEDLNLKANPKPSKDELKKAYRKKAAEYHPDKGGDEEKFKEVSFAYSILISEEKTENFKRNGTGTTNSTEDKVLAELISIFNNYLEMLLSGQKKTLRDYRTKIRRVLEEMDSDIKKADKDFGKLSALKDQITTENEKEENVYLMVLNNKLSEINRKKQMIEEQKEITKKVSEALGKYKEVEDIQQEINRRQFSVSFDNLDSIFHEMRRDAERNFRASGWAME